MEPQKYNNEEMNKNFSLYQSAMQLLFNKKDMQYTSSDYYKLVESNLDNPDINLNLNRNTFYNNREKMNTKYLYSQGKVTKSTKESLASDIYYNRLCIYLVLVSKISHDKPDLTGLQVTKNFFPLYVGLICSDSSTNRWPTALDRIKSTYKVFFTYSKNSFTNISSATATTLYNYWLDLLLSDKLYKLICKIDKINAKENGYPTQSALHYNLTLFMHIVSSIYFKTKIMQDHFLEKTNNLVDQYFQSRVKGTSIADTLDKELCLCFSETEKEMYAEYCK